MKNSNKISKARSTYYALYSLQYSVFNIRYSIFLLVFLAIFSCKTYKLDNLPEEQIVFGNGGGITGATTSYILLKNGQVFKTNSLQGDTTSLIKLKPKVVKQCFEQMAELDWEKTAVNQAGNTYQFIAYKTTENTHRATWGASGYEPPKAIESIYKSLKKALIQE